MMKWETKLQKWLAGHLFMLAYIAIFLLGLFVRLSYFPLLSEDLRVYNIPWLELLREQGIAGVFQDGVFFNYSPLHLYLWGLVAKCTGTVDALMVLKATGLIFDVLFSFVCWRMTCSLLDVKRKEWKSLLALAFLWLHPILIWNVSAWGQTDVVYAVFCVVSLWLLLRECPIRAVLCYAVAFALKMQALFLLPFFIIYYFSGKKKVSCLWFLALPLALLLSGLPLVFFGQSPLYGITNYLGQLDTYTYMTYNYPNLFAVAGDIHLNSQMVVGMHSRFGMMVCLAVLGCMLALCIKHPPRLERSRLLALAAWCVWCCVLFLPRMHERYGLLGEMLLLCWAVAAGKPKGFVYVALNALAVLSAYASYLFQAAFFSLQLGGVLNTIAWGLFTWELVHDLLSHETAMAVESADCIADSE